MLRQAGLLALISASILIFILCIFSLSFVENIQSLNKKIRFSKINVSTFSGNVDNVTYIVRGYPFPIGQIQWHIDIFSFLKLKVCANFSTTLESNYSKGVVCAPYFSNTLHFKNIKFHMEANEVAEVSGVVIEGDFSGELDELIIDSAGAVTAAGNIIWRKAAFFNGEHWISLGNIEINLEQSQERQLLVHWHDYKLDDSLPAPKIDVDIKMIVSKGQLLSVNGFVFPEKDFHPALLDALLLLGKQDGQDRFIINRKIKE